MNGNQQQGNDPEITYRDPRAYIYYLRSRGLNVMQIDDLVRRRFGPGETPEDRARREAEQRQNAGLAQAGGVIGGSILTQQVLQNLPAIKGALLGSQAPTAAAAVPTSATLTPGAVAVPKVVGVQTVGAGTQAGAGTTAAPSTFAAAGPYAAAVAAAIAAGWNLNRSSKKAKTMGAGEGLSSAIKDPINWLIPSGFIGAAFGDKDMYLKEHRRLLDLKKQGVNVPESLLEGSRLAKGRSKEELIALEQDKIAKGGYGNVKFAESRNEADLTPEDIVGYSAFMKKFGNDWFDKFSQAQRLGIAKQALDLGAVREAKGSVDVDWNKLGSVEDLTKLKYSGTPQIPGTSAPNLITQAVPRPGKGEVARQSAGLYRDDTGKLVRSGSVREALQRSYNKTKEKEKK